MSIKATLLIKKYNKELLNYFAATKSAADKIDKHKCMCVLRMLVDYLDNDTLDTYASHKTLAEHMQLNIRVLIMYLNFLVTINILVKKRRKNQQTNADQSNIYSLNLERIEIIGEEFQAFMQKQLSS